MPANPLEIFDKYGWHGVVMFVAWRILAWLGSNGKELVAMHRQHLAANSKQLRRQSVLLKGMLTCLKDQGLILREIRSRQEPRHETSKPTPPQAEFPLPASTPRSISPAPA
jgi:hypothetical protein